MRQFLSKQKRLILNESVNFEQQCIFIAIPKTGTTSVRTQLRQQGIPLIEDPHLNIMQVRDSLYVYFLMSALGRNKIFPTESILEDADIRAQTTTVFNNFFKFSSVRNPWARAVSLYSRREGIQSRDKLTFEEFCDKHHYASDTCGHPTLHKNQIDWLCDENGQCIMDYVYKLESFSEAIKEIEDRTDGRVKLENINANKNPNSPSHKYRDFHTDKTRRIIAERFQKDIDYFKYTF
jgi:sulfotransferase famil protein